MEGYHLALQEVVVSFEEAFQHLVVAHRVLEEGHQEAFREESILLVVDHLRTYKMIIFFNFGCISRFCLNETRYKT